MLILQASEERRFYLLAFGNLVGVDFVQTCKVNLSRNFSKVTNFTDDYQKIWQKPGKVATFQLLVHGLGRIIFESKVLTSGHCVWQVVCSVNLWCPMCFEVKPGDSAIVLVLRIQTVRSEC